MIQTSKKICSLADAIPTIRGWKKDTNKIVFTNGCFDIIHKGHIDYLEEAKNLGDKLIVGINSDASIRKLKGKNRPIIDEASRLRVLAAIECIDMVILFEEETPLLVIKAIHPDILVKGADYMQKEVIGADLVLQNGGKVQLIQITEGYSTSRIVEKIKESE
ncbi:MAG: D-glycero-beta-D-manno-heptose 1-phosphate adenylyltransferase [Chitinophagaceae bacterium]|nr:D-glycero-beta-D-manno-heptose 1-phosphate adenylyltransferase [Chitinophagaceae bacterium]